jgi:ankyrin repeat protein
MITCKPDSCRGSPWIRWLRFRIRALLLVVAVSGLCLGIVHHRDRQQRLDRAILTAAHRGDAQAVRSLLELGANANVVDGGPGFWRPLMHAALHGDSGLVRILLDRGAEIDPQDGDGFTALTIAAEEGHWDVVRLLASRGADIDHRDATGLSALDRAAAGGESGIVSFLEATRRRLPSSSDRP